MRVPAIDASDAEVAAAVRAALVALDTTPRNVRWRYRASGMTMGEALATAPRDFRLSLKVPVGEMRTLRDVAGDRNVGVNVLARRAIGTWMVAVAQVDPAAIPYFAHGGLLL